MKKVLWISRHQMTEEQLSDLIAVLGDEAELTQWENTVKNADELKDAIEAADVICAVLPTTLLADVKAAAGDRPLLQSVSGRVATGRTRVSENGSREQEFRFVHLYWEEIVELKIRTRVLNPGREGCIICL